MNVYEPLGVFGKLVETGLTACDVVRSKVAGIGEGNGAGVDVNPKVPNPPTVCLEIVIVPVGATIAFAAICISWLPGLPFKALKLTSRM